MHRLLRKFLDQFESESAPAAPDRSLATAVLLFEIARADFAQEPVELEVMRSELERYLGVDAAQLDALMAQAQSRSRDAVSLHGYVAAINAELQPQDKRAVMAMLWRVAYADGQLDPNEEHVLRKLADLLFVSHQDYIETKLAASGERG